MEPTTEEKEAETAKAMAKDEAAMEELMKQTLDQAAPPPETETPPPETETPPPEKAEEKTEKPPPTTEKGEEPSKEELDEFEKDLESSKHELPTGATRQAREVIKAVKHTAREEHTLRRAAEAARLAAEAKAKELEDRVAAAVKDREELDRLRPLVETFAIEQDPRINQRFNTEMARINRRLMINLRNFGLEKETADYIIKNGGPAVFSRDSVSQVPAASERPGGEPTQMSHKQFWEERVLKPLSDENRTSLRIAFDDELRLREWRDGELRSKLSNREEYFKNLEEESKKQESDFKAQCKAHLEAQMKELAEFVTEKTIPADATKELKDRLEGYNQIIRDAREKFDESFIDNTPKALVEKNLGRLLMKNVKAWVALKDAEIESERALRMAIQKKWDASLKAANTSNRQSVQQQAKPLDGAVFEKNDGRRMEQMMEQLP